MPKLNTTDPKKIDSFLKKWRYNATDRKTNSMSLGMLGVHVTISMVNEVSFSLRMPVHGDRRNKVVGRFRLDGNGAVIYGTDHALADAGDLRRVWRDEMEGKVTVDPKNIPTFAQLLERYEAGLTDDPDALLTGRTLPASWHKQLPQLKKMYAPFIEANGGKGVKVNFIKRDDIHECHAKYLRKQLQETGEQPFKMVRLMLNAVRPVLKWGNEKYWVQDETVKGLRANVPDESERKRFVLPGEWQKAAPAVLAVHEDADVGLAMRYMLMTACRRSMATQMTWEQLEMVDASAHGRKELMLWCVPAKNMKQGLLAIFPIVGEAARIIEEIRARPGNKCRPHEFVFSKAGRSAWDNNADRWQKEIFTASGTYGWQRHDLRRTTASYLETFGADMPTVKKLLAHRGRSDKSATGGYLSIGKNLAALVKLAPLLERVHQVYLDIEAGRMSADLRLAMSEMKASEDMKAFVQELKDDEDYQKEHGKKYVPAFDIDANKADRAPVVELRPAHA